MSTLAGSLPRPAWARLLRTEGRLLLREPVILFWAVLFPTVLLVVLGIASNAHEKDLGGLRVVDVYAPILVTFVFTTMALAALPAAVATYRERGILRRFGTTPAPPSALLGAQVAVNLAVGVVALALVLAVGRLGFDVALPKEVPAYVLSALLTAAALIGLGLLVAALAPSGRTASAIGAILFFPLMFFAGLWVPRDLMSHTLRSVSDLTPLGAGVEALQQATLGHWPGATAIGVLAGWGVVFTLAATRFFRWE